MLSPEARSWLYLFAIIAFTFAPSVVVARQSDPAVQTWYKGLRKPPWTPPNWLFAPVWTVLYLAMSVAVWLVWKADPTASFAFQLYALQWALNHAWSPLFFIARKPGWALVDIGALWLLLVVIIATYAAIVPLAGKLMGLYLAWVTFATALNYRCWADNRTPS